MDKDGKGGKKGFRKCECGICGCGKVTCPLQVLLGLFPLRFILRLCKACLGVKKTGNNNIVACPQTSHLLECLARAIDHPRNEVIQCMPAATPAYGSNLYAFIQRHADWIILSSNVFFTQLQLLTIFNAERRESLMASPLPGDTEEIINAQTKKPKIQSIKNNLKEVSLGKLDLQPIPLPEQNLSLLSDEQIEQLQMQHVLLDEAQMVKNQKERLRKKRILVLFEGLLRLQGEREMVNKGEQPPTPLHASERDEEETTSQMLANVHDQKYHHGETKLCVSSLGGSNTAETEDPKKKQQKRTVQIQAGTAVTAGADGGGSDDEGTDEEESRDSGDLEEEDEEEEDTGTKSETDNANESDEQDEKGDAFRAEGVVEPIKAMATPNSREIQNRREIHKYVEIGAGINLAKEDGLEGERDTEHGVSSADGHRQQEHESTCREHGSQGAFHHDGEETTEEDQSHSGKHFLAEIRKQSRRENEAERACRKAQEQHYIYLTPLLSPIYLPFKEDFTVQENYGIPEQPSSKQPEEEKDHYKEQVVAETEVAVREMQEELLGRCCEWQQQANVVKLQQQQNNDRFSHRSWQAPSSLDVNVQRSRIACTMDMQFKEVQETRRKVSAKATTESNESSNNSADACWEGWKELHLNSSSSGGQQQTPADPCTWEELSERSPQAVPYAGENNAAFPGVIGGPNYDEKLRQLQQGMQFLLDSRKVLRERLQEQLGEKESLKGRYLRSYEESLPSDNEREQQWRGKQRQTLQEAEYVHPHQQYSAWTQRPTTFHKGFPQTLDEERFPPSASLNFGDVPPCSPCSSPAGRILCSSPAASQPDLEAGLPPRVQEEQRQWMEAVQHQLEEEQEFEENQSVREELTMQQLLQQQQQQYGQEQEHGEERHCRGYLPKTQAMVSGEEALAGHPYADAAAKTEPRNTRLLQQRLMSEERSQSLQEWQEQSQHPQEQIHWPSSQQQHRQEKVIEHSKNASSKGAAAARRKATTSSYFLWKLPEDYLEEHHRNYRHSFQVWGSTPQLAPNVAARRAQPLVPPIEGPPCCQFSATTGSGQPGMAPREPQQQQQTGGPAPAVKGEAGKDGEVPRVIPQQRYARENAATANSGAAKDAQYPAQDEEGQFAFDRALQFTINHQCQPSSGEAQAAQQLPQWLTRRETKKEKKDNPRASDASEIATPTWQQQLQQEGPPGLRVRFSCGFTSPRDRERETPQQQEESRRHQHHQQLQEQEPHWLDWSQAAHSPSYCSLASPPPSPDVALEKQQQQQDEQLGLQDEQLGLQQQVEQIEDTWLSQQEEQDEQKRLTLLMEEMQQSWVDFIFDLVEKEKTKHNANLDMQELQQQEVQQQHHQQMQGQLRQQQYLQLQQQQRQHYLQQQGQLQYQQRQQQQRQRLLQQEQQLRYWTPQHTLQKQQETPVDVNHAKQLGRSREHYSLQQQLQQQQHEPENAGCGYWGDLLSIDTQATHAQHQGDHQEQWEITHDIFWDSIQSGCTLATQALEQQQQNQRQVCLQHSQPRQEEIEDNAASPSGAAPRIQLPLSQAQQQRPVESDMLQKMQQLLQQHHVQQDMQERLLRLRAAESVQREGRKEEVVQQLEEQAELQRRERLEGEALKQIVCQLQKEVDSQLTWRERMVGINHLRGRRCFSVRPEDSCRRLEFEDACCCCKSSSAGSSTPMALIRSQAQRYRNSDYDEAEVMSWTDENKSERKSEDVDKMSEDEEEEEAAEPEFAEACCYLQQQQHAGGQKATVATKRVTPRAENVLIEEDSQMQREGNLHQQEEAPHGAPRNRLEQMVLSRETSESLLIWTMWGPCNGTDVQQGSEEADFFDCAGVDVAVFTSIAHTPFDTATVSEIVAEETLRLQMQHDGWVLLKDEMASGEPDSAAGPVEPKETAPPSLSVSSAPSTVVLSDHAALFDSTPQQQEEEEEEDLLLYLRSQGQWHNKVDTTGTNSLDTSRALQEMDDWTLAPSAFSTDSQAPSSNKNSSGTSSSWEHEEIDGWTFTPSIIREISADSSNSKTSSRIDYHRQNTQDALQERQKEPAEKQEKENQQEQPQRPQGLPPLQQPGKSIFSRFRWGLLFGSNGS